MATGNEQMGLDLAAKLANLNGNVTLDAITQPVQETLTLSLMHQFPAKVIIAKGVIVKTADGKTFTAPQEMEMSIESLLNSKP